LSRLLPAAAANGCDCHVHIYDLDRYPLASTSTVGPTQATWENYVSFSIGENDLSYGDRGELWSKRLRKTRQMQNVGRGAADIAVADQCSGFII
jgi:hypothetical protein